jgi:hypothetical protein
MAEYGRNMYQFVMANFLFLFLCKGVIVNKVAFKTEVNVYK